VRWAHCRLAPPAEQECQLSADTLAREGPEAAAAGLGDEPGAAPPDAVQAATDEVMADVFEVRAEGDNDLTRFFDLTLVGSLVSLHLAAREGVDPGPVPTVDEAQAGTLTL